MADLSSFGTAEEIAAAAMAAAGLEDIFGIHGAGKEASSSNLAEDPFAGSVRNNAPPHLTSTLKSNLKRSHDEIEGGEQSLQQSGVELEAEKRINASELGHDSQNVAPDPSYVSFSATANDDPEYRIGDHDKASDAEDIKPIASNTVSDLVVKGSEITAMKQEAEAKDLQRKSELPEGTKVPEPRSDLAQTPSASAALALLSGIQNLEAVAQAAMGLDAQGNPLPGNEESHRALAEAVKRLSGSQTYHQNPFVRNTGSYQPESSNVDADESPLKRFQCHLCERAFARAYNLNTHLATHDPDPAKSKPFPCPYPSCKADGGRSFSRKHDLQRHVASTHENEPVPEDEEDVDENGSRISVLTKLGLGTPGRKFRCEDCGRAFVRRDALKRHQCVPNALTPPSSNGSPQAVSSNRSAVSSSGVGHAISVGANQVPSASIPTMPLGLSLYTSTAPDRSTNHAAQNSHSSQRGQNAALSPSLSYESLSREVQDMAMHLVAQATSYNEAHGTIQSTRAIPSSETKGKEVGRPA